MIGDRAKLGVDVDVDSSGVDPGVRQTEGKLGRLGGIARKAGVGIAAGVAVGAVAVVGLGVKSIKAASDVQQSFGALDAVYGKNSAQVKKWAAGAATSVGLAKSEYANLSAVIGSQLQSMGFAQDASAKKSNSLIKLGSDLAATYGGTVSDAVSAVSSVLKGETDPIERYGVSIKQSDINARLAAQGLDHLTGKAAKQAQAQAVLGLLTEQTGKAQGQFAKQTGTLAEQQQILGAKFENLKPTLGEKLLPVATAVFSWANDKLLPASARLGRYLDKNLSPAFAAVGRFINTRVIPAARQLYAWFVDKIAPNLKRTLTPILNSVRSAFASVSRAVGDNRPQLQKLGRALGDVAEFAVKHILPLFGKQLGLSFKIAGRVIGTMIDVVGRLVDGFSAVKHAVQDVIKWIGKIHVPNINIPGLAGHYGTATAMVSGRAAGYAPRGGLATSAWSDLDLLAGLARSGPAGGAAVVTIDARTFVEIHDAFDEVAVARKLQGVLNRQQVRLQGLVGGKRR